MKIQNIESLKRNINSSIMLMFGALFFFTMLGLSIVHYQYIQKRDLLNNEELRSAANSLKSNLSEKLSIIASSIVFQDYLHSGEVTRKRLYPQLLLQINSLNSNIIKGMQIINNAGHVVFSDGDASEQQATIYLCYLNENLDQDLGNCQASWKIYFNAAELINSLAKLNKSIKPCDSCTPWNFIDDGKLGRFTVKDAQGFKLKIAIIDDTDYFFISYLVLISISLGLFGFWSWSRLSDLLNNYIAHPINSLTSCFKGGEVLKANDNNIDEIEYLIEEINRWKVRLQKAQDDESAEAIAKIVAQFAHDVRSPLAVINIMIKELADLDAGCKTVIIGAVDRISDIANQFLHQYKNPKLLTEPQSLKEEHISALLESIVYEKQAQHQKTATITLEISEASWADFSMLNASDFKRIISNITNNAVEAAPHHASIAIRMYRNDNYINLEIEDNGCGIDENIIPGILKGGLSVGKEGGFGMGLSHAYNTIKSWGGDLSITSRLNRGTTILIKLLVIETSLK